MSEGGVRVTGLKETVRKLESLGVEVTDIKDVMAAIARQGATLAESYAPHDSGRLEASIKGNRAKGKATVKAGSRRVPYAGVINYGWPRRGITADGFMQRTDEELAPKAVALLTDGLTDLIAAQGLA